MKVWIVFQGWQNDTEVVIGVYADEKLAEERQVLEESTNDDSRIYFYYEGYEVMGVNRSDCHKINIVNMDVGK